MVEWTWNTSFGRISEFIRLRHRNLHHLLGEDGDDTLSLIQIFLNFVRVRFVPPVFVIFPQFDPPRHLCTGLSFPYPIGGALTMSDRQCSLYRNLHLPVIRKRPRYDS